MRPGFWKKSLEPHPFHYAFPRGSPHQSDTIVSIFPKFDIIVPFFCQEFMYLGRMKNYPYLLESLGIAVEKVRKERKMTKTALASFSDLQDCYIRGIIKGKRNPTITVIYSICEALDIPPLEFFRRVTEEMEALQNGARERPSGTRLG